MNPTLEKTSMLVTGITLASGIGYVGLMLQLGIW